MGNLWTSDPCPFSDKERLMAELRLSVWGLSDWRAGRGEVRGAESLATLPSGRASFCTSERCWQFPHADSDEVRHSDWVGCSGWDDVWTVIYLKSWRPHDSWKALKKKKFFFKSTNENDSRKCTKSENSVWKWALILLLIHSVSSNGDFRTHKESWRARWADGSGKTREAGQTLLIKRWIRVSLTVLLT